MKRNGTISESREVYLTIWRFMIAPWMITAMYMYSTIILLNYIEKALLM